jgi:molecular chaperone HscB
MASVRRLQPLLRYIRPAPRLCALSAVGCNRLLVPRLCVTPLRTLSARAAAHTSNSFDSAHDELRCKSCGCSLAPTSLFCSCGKPQKLNPSKVNHFQLFGVAPAVLLNEKALERSFWALQKQLHPDLFATRAAEDRDISAANAAAVNVAYQTLREPLTRVQYLISLMRGDNLSAPLQEEQTSAVPDPQLLMQVYETREALEECQSIEEADKVLADHRKATLQQLSSLVHAFEQGDLAAMETGLMKLQYLKKIEVEARNLGYRLSDAADGAAAQ